MNWKFDKLSPMTLSSIIGSNDYFLLSSVIMTYHPQKQLKID